MKPTASSAHSTVSRGATARGGVCSVTLSQQGHDCRWVAGSLFPDLRTEQYYYTKDMTALCRTPEVAAAKFIRNSVIDPPTATTAAATKHKTNPLTTGATTKVAQTLPFSTPEVAAVNFIRNSVTDCPTATAIQAALASKGHRNGESPRANDNNPNLKKKQIKRGGPVNTGKTLRNNTQGATAATHINSWARCTMATRALSPTMRK